FDTGHASTSISAALGILQAKRLRGEPGKAVAVIGDGALTGGMALEALSHAGQLGLPLVVVLNDNKMSISPNVGALSRYLTVLTTTRRYQSFRSYVDSFIRRIPVIGPRLGGLIYRGKRAVKGLIFKENLFSDLGFEYAGPIDGHDLTAMIRVLRDARDLDRPVVVHVVTRKGKGFDLAEEDPSAYHGVPPQRAFGGEFEPRAAVSFTEAFSDALVCLGESDPKIVAITAAMTKGTGLEAFKVRYPSRFFDVGIAEQHAVTFAAGLASGGLKPVVALYSTFVQRSIDQVFHDVALPGLPVVLALDRAGAVGEDGETHQGIYDIPVLRAFPNMTILAPASAVELALCLEWALSSGGPVAVRYPKASCPREDAAYSTPLVRGRGVFVRRSGADTLIVAMGGLVSLAVEASDVLV
ncbi:MAG: 1-deoxy-D-xylulose-5-phosphate synthase, partial [Spirochaetaceae bacterium]|nr:1-deoxy-D-xylulose-5-phosphate synthase [Spirochaetaceae bacterium]